MTSGATKEETSKPGRFPAVERLAKAVGIGVLFGGGSTQLLGGGVAMSLTAAGLAIAIYLREVVRGGTSWRELLALLPLAAAILIALHFYLVPAGENPDLGKPHVIGLGGVPRSIASSSDAVWIVAADGTLSTIGQTGLRDEVQLRRGLRDVAFAFGYAWVARGRELLAVDAKLKVVGSKRYRSQIAALAVSRRGVWILRPAASRVDLIRPGSGHVAAVINVDHARAIATDHRHLWVVRATADSERGLLLEYTESGQLLRRIGVDGDPRALAVDGAYAWVSYYDDGDLTRVTKTTVAQDEISTNSSSLVGIALGPTSVWVIDEEEDLTQVNPAEKRVVGKVTAGRQPLDILFWRRAVFVVSGVDGIVKVFPTSTGDSGAAGVVVACP